MRDEGLVERGREAGARLLRGLETVAERTGAIRELRGRGLMVALEIQDDDENTRAARVHRGLFERGFIVGRRPAVSVLRLDPPLVIQPAEIDAFLGALEAALVEARDT